MFGSNNYLQSNISIFSKTLPSKNSVSKTGKIPFSINSFSYAINNKPLCTFNVNKLKKIRDDKKNKIKTEYEKRYIICLNKIEKVNRNNMTEMIYEIPAMMINCSKYKSIDCLNYINERLLKQYMDTLYISDHSIFISWFYIEENEKIKREEKRKREEKS